MTTAPLTRQRNERVRAQVFDHYGWDCRCCGTTDSPSIDHIAGDGKRHRESQGIGRSGDQMYRWLVANNFPDGFQTLCLPCNKSKGERELCIIDHASGATAGMTNAERARRWRQLAKPVRNWGTCAGCGLRQRLRGDGLIEAHNGCLGGRRAPAASPGCVKGLGWPLTPFADLIRARTTP